MMAGLVSAGAYRAAGLYGRLRERQEANAVRPDQRAYDWETADPARFEVSRRAPITEVKNQPKHSPLLDKLRAGEPVVVTWGTVRPLVPVVTARLISDGDVLVRVHSDDRVQMAGYSAPDVGVW